MYIKDYCLMYFEFKSNVLKNLNDIFLGSFFYFKFIIILFKLNKY